MLRTPDGFLKEGSRVFRPTPADKRIIRALLQAAQTKAKDAEIDAVSLDTRVEAAYDAVFDCCLAVLNAERYVHIADLCAAHLLALERLMGGKVSGFNAFNLGTGKGYSVKEVIETCRRVTGQDIRYRLAGRRAGDPARLVASASRARAELGWSPDFNDLSAIVETAWRWFSRQPVQISG